MAAVIQRPLRGSRISTFYPVKNLPSLASLDSAFQLQEYISLLIRLDVHDVEAIISLPGTSSRDKDPVSEQEKAELPEGAKDGEKDPEKGKNEVTVDEACWIYEQLRRLAQDLSHPLITTLQQECTRASCPEMKAGEWLYLCVAHGNDGAMEQCCAIDYILHTVDSATALLNSPRTFPSRLSIPQTSHRHFSSLARRLGRIFAHAYFHHREAFEQAEAESSLYARFLALTAKFDLVPSEFLVIPSAQFSAEDSGPSRDRDYSPHDYNDNQRRYPSKMMPEVNNSLPTSVGQKYVQQQSLGVDRSRSPNPPGLGRAGSASASGGIGESPTSTSRSRFGRNRTDTMVFADAEASAVADELAARARAGELEADYEHEGPKTARPGENPESEKDQEEDEPDLEGDTQFEISLSPEEEIVGTYVDIKGIPTVLDEEEELEEKSGDDSAPSQPEPVLEKHLAKEEEPEKVPEPAPAPSTAVPPVEPEPEPETKAEEEKALEPIPSESEEAKESVPVVEAPVVEEEPAAVPPSSTTTTAPAPEEGKEAVPEKDEAYAEPPVETQAPASVLPVAEETAAPAKSEVVEPTISSTASSPPLEAPLSAPEPTSAAPALAPSTESVAEPTTLDTPSHPVESPDAESTKSEETIPVDSKTVTTENTAPDPKPEVAEASAEMVKEEGSATPASAEATPAAKEPEATSTTAPQAS